MAREQKKTNCAQCGEVIDFEEEGGHIYADGSTLCASCEAEGDNKRTINDIKRELEETSAL